METRLNQPTLDCLRVIQWGIVSLIIHVALLSFVGQAPPVLPYRPMVVDLLYTPATATDPLTKGPNATETPEVAVTNPTPQAPNPKDDSTREPVAPKTTTEAPAPLETYFSMNDVDVRAEPANDVPLSYPPAAYVQHISGRVRFNLFINEKGHLDRYELVGSSPKGLFESAAQEAVSQLIFHPAIKNGLPVKSQKTIDVVFDPSSNPAIQQPGAPGSLAREK